MFVKMTLVLFCVMFSFNVRADEECSGERANQINNLKQSFKNCLLDFPEENDSNIVMIEITKDKIQCMKNLSYQIFDIFYASSKDEKKQQLDDFVNNVIEQSYNIEQGSDIGKKWHNSSFYELGALNNAYVIIHNVVKDYIHTMELECVEFSDEALIELNNIL